DIDDPVDLAFQRREGGIVEALLETLGERRLVELNARHALADFDPRHLFLPGQKEDNALRAAGAPRNRLQGLEMGCGCGQRLALYRTVMTDQFLPARRERRAAARAAAGLGGHQRLLEGAVDLGDQLPGALVRHVHGAARGRDRALALDLLQQRDLAGPEPALVVEVDADTEMGHRPLLEHIPSGRNRPDGICLLQQILPGRAFPLRWNRANGPL